MENNTFAVKEKLDPVKLTVKGHDPIFIYGKTSQEVVQSVENVFGYWCAAKSSNTDCTSSDTPKKQRKPWGYYSRDRKQKEEKAAPSPTS